MGGGDKSLMRLGDRPIIAHIIACLRGQATSLAINANRQFEQYRKFGLPVIPDSIDGNPGPLVGILAAMDWAFEQSAQHVLTVPSDTPFLPTNLTEKLEAAAKFIDGIAVAASLGDRHPVVALWPVALREELREILIRGGSHRVRDFVAGRKNVEVSFPLRADGLDPFFNINRPADLATAQTALKRRKT